jgi:hypothetical protein
MRCFGFAPHDGGEALLAEGAVLFREMDALPGLLRL